MPRLFTGFEVPPDIALRLSLLQGGLHGARWIDRENYHITLRFIGDVDDHTADEVAHALSRIHRPPLEIVIQGTGAFGNRKPHSVWVRIAPTPELAELQAEQERLLQRLGLEPEGRKYVPHITLARLRGTSQQETADWLSLRGDLAIPPFSVDRFVLFSSRASRGGGPYLVEEAYPLAA